MARIVFEERLETRVESSVGVILGAASKLDAQQARHERRHRVLLLAAVCELVSVEDNRARVADPEAVLREFLRLSLRHGAARTTA